MKSRFKSVLFGLSLVFNGIFTAALVTASFSKSSTFYYQTPPDDYVAAAAVVSLPKDREAVFELVSMSLKQGESAFLQFSFIPARKQQGNLLINSIFDPGIVSISQTGYGIEIHALHEGETLMQTLTNDGVKNVALIRVAE